MPPQHFQAAQQLDPFKSSLPAAGVTTSRLTEIDRCDHVSKVNAAKQNTRRGNSDPITHKYEKEETLFQDEIDGAAGITSSRLTAMNADWAEIPRGKFHGNNPLFPNSSNSGHKFNPPDRGGVIAHIGGYHPDPVTTGQRKFSIKGRSSVPLEHHDKYVVQSFLSPKEIQERGGVIRQKEVPIQGGHILYNIGGYNDLLPPATAEYLPSDLPVSKEYKVQNDKRQLPQYVHLRTPLKRSDINRQSPEMVDIMYGRGTAW